MPRRSLTRLICGGRVVFARTFRSLRLRNYRLWFIGQTISLTGTWMQSLAQSWLVYKLTGSAVDLGITVGLQFAPVLLLGAAGGLVADRVNKRSLLLATQIAFLLQSLVLGALLFMGVAQIWMVWVLASIYGLINVLDNPTRQSFVMEMVGPDDLANAVGLNSVIVNASRIVGPALAGVLIVAVGLAWTFIANAATFVAVIAALLMMDTAALHRSAPVGRAKGQIRAGVRYAWNKWELRVPLLMMAVVGTLSYNFSILLPLLAGNVFHQGAGTLSALTVAMGVGALAGALFTAARKRPGYRLLVAVTLAFGVLTMGVAFAPSLPIALAFLVPMGGASVSFIAMGNSLLQLHSSGAMRGRVMGLWAIVFLGSTPIGGPLAGFLAGHLGTRAALAIGGVAALLAAGGAALALHRIRAEEVAESLTPLPAEAGAAEGMAAQVAVATAVDEQLPVETPREMPSHARSQPGPAVGPLHQRPAGEALACGSYGQPVRGR